MSQITIESNLKESLKLLTTSHAKVTVDFLQSLAETFRCQWATYWVVDHRIKKLTCCMNWKDSNIDLSILYAETKTRQLTLNEGVPGQVWSSKKVFLSDDLEMEMALPRSIYAFEAGLRHGIWIPVVYNGQPVYGVIELLGVQQPVVTKDLVSVLGQFGFEIGKLKKAQSI